MSSTGAMDPDVLIGGSGNDRLEGGADDDSLFGGKGEDEAHGGANDDVIKGGSANDVLYGGSGDDYLNGGSDSDSLYGGDDDDKLKGGSGDDSLFGDAGNDVLYGGDGDDTLRGGAGDDKLFGGTDIAGDVADYEGNIADYEITILGPDRLTVEDISGGPDGIDTLSGIRLLRFADGTLDPFNITPAAPTIDLTAASDSGLSDSDHITVDTTPTLEGTAAAGTTVEIFDAGISLGTTVAGADGTWSFTTTGLADGTHSLTATATDPSGNTSPASTPLAVTIDTTAPALPTIDLAAASDSGQSDSDDLTAATALTLSGTAEAGTTVEVFDGAASLGTTVADGGGAWSLLAGSLAEGSHTLTARATDTAGNTSPASAGLAIEIDTSAPDAPIILGITEDSGSSDSDGMTNDTDLVVSGTAEAGSTVELFDGVTSLGSTQADGAGIWSLQTGVLAEGSHRLTATASDAAGNTGPASAGFDVEIDTTVPVAPVIVSVTDGIAGASLAGFSGDAGPMVNGTAAAGAMVEVFDGATSLGTTLATGAGDWSLQTAALSDGTHILTATASDAAGNTSAASTGYTVEIDTSAPASPVITGISDDSGSSPSDGITNDADLMVSGTAEAGSTVELFDGSTSLGTTLADNTGPGRYRQACWRRAPTR